MRKRFLSILLTVCLVLTLLPTTALAATGDFGDFSVIYDDSSTAPTYNSNTLTLGSGTYTISGTTTVDKIVVSSGVVANITLNGVNIDVSGISDACAFDMTGATVNLTLEGTNSLKSGKTKAGLRVPDGATLTITGTSTGSLQATSADADASKTANGAGIGGNGGLSGGEACGTVTISSGSITAIGGGYSTSPISGAAGIGGGASYWGTGGTGGTVTISGGTVTAIGGGQNISCGGAGIGGGGGHGAGGTVTISGGNVTATGGGNSADSRKGGAGIGGGGRGGAGAKVTITGGSVKATGASSNAQIGVAIGAVDSSNLGSLTNGSTNGNMPVSLYTLTLPGVTSATEVTALTTMFSLGYTYGTNDMKTDTDGKLYVYLPANRTSASVTAGGTDFNATSSNFAAGYAVSGTVSTGTTGVGVSGLTVNLYASSDTTFSTALCNATTNGSGSYAINGIPNGSYVARVAGVDGSYAASVSNTITVSDGQVSGADITLAALTTQSIAVKAGSHKTAYLVGEPLDVTNLKITVTRNDGSTYDKNVTADMVSGFDSSSFAENQSLTITFDGQTTTYTISISRANYSGSVAPTPTLISKTDAQVVLSAVTVTGQTVEYGKNTSNATPTEWQDGTTFTGLTAGATYYFFARVKQTAAMESGGESSALSVTTKTASGAPAKPTISTGADKPTSNSITISTAAGNEYYISTSNTAPTTWPTSGNDYFKATGTDVHTFTGLTAGTQYYIHVRVAETNDAMPSASDYVAQYTAAATPSTGQGYTINYSAESIGITDGYEVSSDSSFASDKLLLNGAVVTPGVTYYVRKKADTTTSPNIPASAYIGFTVSARPGAPTAASYSYDYKNEKIIFDSQYEVFTATSEGIAVTSGSTAITPGSTLYIRAKSTASALASDWTMITVPARSATTGLSISTSKTDTAISVTPITGAEYSKDGGNTWQSSNEFTGLNPNTDYEINIRYAATASNFASTPFGNVTLKTKTAAGDAPSDPSISAQNDKSITINMVSGCQYAITTSDTAPTTWGVTETTTGTKTFSDLSAATRYYIWVRTAETDTAMSSNAGKVSVYTAAAAPTAGEGYTIDYSAETISYDSIYEITADTTTLPLTIIGSGDSITSNISDNNTAPKKIYVRVKALTDGAPAGAWMEVTLPARSQTTSASALAETVSNKNDGKISGVTTAMEWKAAAGTYTDVTADQALNGITGLADGTYYLRQMAVSGTGFKSAEQEIAIAAGHTITVTFNTTSGSTIGAITGKDYGDSITDPEKPSRSGYYFAGWYKEPACTNAWTFDLDTLTDNITLYAKWSAIPTYTVTGKIVDNTSHAVDGATVRMMQGATQFGTMGVADTNGDFTINNVPPGIYNLVITKGTKTAIVKVNVSSGNVAIGNAILPSGNANSILVVNGSDTPNIVVGGLDGEAVAQLAHSNDANADKVDITLTVEKKNASTATNGSEVTSSITAAGKQVGMILAIDVKKTVNGTEDNSYRQTNGLLEINIPLPVELQGKASYEIYRYHGTSVDTITETPNADLERIVIDRTNWAMTLYAKKFSTYAIGYTNPSSGGRGGGGGVATTPVSTTTAAIESEKTVALPYYVENGKEIMVGFASNASGTMKYIVPKGVKVLFRENPKKFNDIAGHWAKGNIDFVTQRELFYGTENGNFSPQSGMTRAMFATVIGRLYERSYGELTLKDDHNFTDVDKKAYYATYIDWASENNIITGIGSGLFKPDQQITRQEMAAILYRFAEFLNVLPAGSKTTQLNYPDGTQISSWATEGAMYCQQTQIITGRLGGNFVPQGTATRAEVAAILQRFIENSVK